MGDVVTYSKNERFMDIPVSMIQDFPNHPYKVKDDESMNELVESIKTRGLIQPVLVRPIENGMYEMVSGHRRKRAFELAGIEKIPARVQNLTRDEAIDYDEKKGAGSAILAACKAMTSPEPKVIGSYRGFNMELSFNTFEKEYVLTLVGSLRHSTPLGGDIYGNITRIDNLISSMPDKLKACEERLSDTKTQLENAKLEIERPFPQEEELSQKMERLAELNALLDMDHKDNEIVEGEPDGVDVTERKEREVER